MRSAAFLATLGAIADLSMAAPTHQLSRRDATTSLAITYDIFNADNSCKTQDQVNTDFGVFEGYDLVRLYGPECDQYNLVHQAASAKGMRVMAGVFDLSTATDDVNNIISVFQSDWGSLDTVAIGNELVNSGSAAVGDVVNALNAARDQLRGAGFQGPVVTVDTFNAIEANPDLCSNSDYAAANAHPFFDGSSPSSNAGPWVQTAAANVGAACPGKSVVITETGWPHQGDTNGQAVPSPADQTTALNSIRGAFPNGGLMLFNSFDDLWKTNTPATFDAEQFWGIYPTPSYSSTLDHSRNMSPDIKQYQPTKVNKEIALGAKKTRKYMKNHQNKKNSS